MMSSIRAIKVRIQALLIHTRAEGILLLRGHPSLARRSLLLTRRTSERTPREDSHEQHAPKHTSGRDAASVRLAHPVAGVSRTTKRRGGGPGRRMEGTAEPGAGKKTKKIPDPPAPARRA